MNNTIHPTIVSLVRTVALVAIILSILLLYGLSFSITTATEPPGGLVPCEGAGCTACDFVKLGNTVLVWLIGVLMVVFAIIAAYAGFRLVTSAGNVEAKSDAKSKLVNAIIGIIIVLAAWLLVDTIMRGLLSGGTGEISGYGPWSRIECGVQFTPVPRGTAGEVGSPDDPVGAGVPHPDESTFVSLRAMGVNVANWHGTNGPDRTDLLRPDAANAILSVQQQAVAQYGGVPMQITSAYTRGVGHSANSRHYEGHAVDFQPTQGSSATLQELADMARDAGFTYVLVESRHVHADMR